MFSEVCLDESNRDLYRFLIESEGLIQDRQSSMLLSFLPCHVIIVAIYVDDFFSRANNADKAKAMRKQVNHLLANAGMLLKIGGVAPKV